jgi:hypothetical protein
MIYQTELLNLKNPENAKFMSDLAYNCFLIGGKKGRDPVINNFYFKYHGTKEEFENSKKELIKFKKIRAETIKQLEEQVRNVPDNVKRVRQNFVFNGEIYFVEMPRE